VAQQQLAGSQVAGPLVDQGHFRPAQTVRAVGPRFQPDRADPLVESRPYWRVEMWSPARLLLGNSQSSHRRPRRSSQARSASRVGSVISNGTGLPVFCWITVARSRSAPPGAMSLTFNFTRSQPRSLASIAQLNSARSRTRRAVFR
jgi:hypothetical protein